MDVVEGKGQGLVILLHGPPGVGKTLTAETVALATGKPLLSVTTAEIGIEPKEAERNLTEIFQHASRWEAVLLIDEADVFLEERKGTKDIQRNSLVAVLLRVLEYYEDIIILTTNRITSLDVAVQSRIHLAIQYRDLNAKQKEKIFHYFLDKTIGENRIEGRARINREIHKILKKSRINGRQIRNVVRSAYLLAQSNKSKLNFDHIEEVLDATENFLESLKDLTLKKMEFLEAPTMD
ncbi:hypothetical protein CMUS01_12327 [Colletotrichum musicola]|uniref:AAA+ ATPase domain-containing protein n=1 Tax=Colletotrichum musicola TaxID=2175873 RepID=A0A8H6N0S6_9PEZI|nr:hypothetical protein CMUS01_12327 [Colletotrichum musicola]